MPIFTLICILQTQSVGRRSVTGKQWSQRWELMMGCSSTKNSPHAASVCGERSLGLRDRALRSFKKGAWLVCYYWPTDVRVSVTCLVKRKEFEGRGERGLLCNQLQQWLTIISMREISRHTQGVSKPPTRCIYLSFLLLLLPTSCVLPLCSSNI